LVSAATLVEVFDDAPAIEHPFAVVDDRREPLGLAAGPLHDPGEAARHHVEVEPLVLERILGRPHERAGGGAMRHRQVVEGDLVILRHGLFPLALGQLGLFELD
jgi:hypothetical protein